MNIIAPSDFTTMPWKNGGGITHEILKREISGKMLWRFSIAEVASDGPFSRFEGLSRILTVIDGAGLILNAPEGALHALPFAPVAFSGDLPIDSMRLAGKVRDFNVIFDPRLVAATVTPARGIVDVEAPSHGFHALLLTGASSVERQPVPAGSFIFLDEGKARIESTAPMLHVTCRSIT